MARGYGVRGCCARGTPAGRRTLALWLDLSPASSFSLSGPGASLAGRYLGARKYFQIPRNLRSKLRNIINLIYLYSGTNTSLKPIYPIYNNAKTCLN